jgi:hypothetical protein
MSRIFIGLLLVLGVFAFTSCGQINSNSTEETTVFRNNRTRMLDKGNEEEKADDRMKQILDIIENKDNLKILFSEKVLQEANDFDKSMSYLFDFIQGDIISCERRKWTSSELIKSGKHSQKVVSWHIVKTDKKDYEFFIIDYPIDAINPNNEGLYTLNVYEYGRNDPKFVYWQDMEIPGIYRPE